MRILLDTQVWLWLQTSPARLGREAGELVRDTSNTLYLSAASSWEIAIKYAIGRLPLPVAPATFVPDRMRRSGVDGVAVEHSHALHVATLPPHHRDPFDRLLIAQAQLEGFVVLSADPSFDPYDVELLPAV
ncbi:MAG: type II toxin-antitoxin system VapC family toxin [Actinomycetota bacterium]